MFACLLFKPETRDSQLYFGLVSKLLRFIPQIQIPQLRLEEGEHMKICVLYAGFLRHVLLCSDPLLIHEVSLNVISNFVDNTPPDQLCGAGQST